MNMGLCRISLKENSDLLAIASLDGGAYLLNVNTGDLLVEPHILRSPSEMKLGNFCVPNDVQFGHGLSSDRLFVAYEQSYDRKTAGHLKQWEMRSNTIPEAVYSVGPNAVSCFALSADGMYNIKQVE